MKVTLAWAAPGREWHAAVELPAGAVLGDALAASGALAAVPEPAALRYAIFGENARPDTPLRDGDRIELTRPLIADPKAVRRRRAADKPVKVRPKPPRASR